MFYLVTIVIKTQIFKCKKFDEFPSTFMRQKTQNTVKTIFKCTTFLMNFL